METPKDRSTVSVEKCLLYGILSGMVVGLADLVVNWNTYGRSPRIPWLAEAIGYVAVSTIVGAFLGVAALFILAASRRIK